MHPLVKLLLSVAWLMEDANMQHLCKLCHGGRMMYCAGHAGNQLFPYAV